MTREGREILIAARVQELKMYARLASAIYEVRRIRAAEAVAGAATSRQPS